MNQNTHAIEQIKREIKKVRRAGGSAFIFGWILLIVSAGVIWPLNNKTLIIALFSVSFLYGIYYIFTGQYIRVGKGDKSQSLLRWNGILALPLCLLLIPIVICAQSFKNASRFKKFPQQIKDLYNKPRSLGLAWWQIVFLILAILLALGSVVFKVRDVNQAEAANTAAGQEEVERVNTAEKSGFIIVWPEDFTATDLTKEIGGHVVPYTAYVSPKQTTEVYTVYAYDYPNESFHFDTMTDKQLATANKSLLFSTVNELHGKKAKSQSSTFMTYPSEDGEFISQTLSGTLNGYIRTFYIRNMGYAIVAVGAEKAAFENFANSFTPK